jgi:predicted TIM-barrel fold metal-dependent hydrolase
MDDAEVERSVVCGFSWGRPDLCNLHNEYLIEAASRYRHRLIVFISLLPSDPDWSGRELEQGVKAGVKGVGEIAFYHREMTIQDIHSMKPLLLLMENLGMPILLHTNERLGHSYPGKGMTPVERFYEIVLAFPQLPIVLAHWGGGLLFYELMPEVAKRMVNVYYDTAASPFLYSKRIYPVASEIVGAKKILFGTDFPLIPPRRYFQELEASDLSVEDQKKILGLNLSKLLKLDGEAG